MRHWLSKAFLSLSTTAVTGRASTHSLPTSAIPFSPWAALLGFNETCSRKSQERLLSVRGGSHEYTVLSDPAPGSPFHYAFPVHNLALAKEFYGGVLGCNEGRSSEKWQDYSLHGHQIVAHWAGADYRCQDYYNPVDGDEVPVPRKCL